MVCTSRMNMPFLILFTSAIWLAFHQWAIAETRQPKFSGTQFAAERQRDAVPTPLRRSTATTPSLLPELQVKVLVPSGETVKPGLSGVLRAGQRPRARGAEQLLLRDATSETLRLAREASEVASIEIERPKQSRPITRVPFDPERRIPFNQDARRSHAVPEFEATFHNGFGASIKAAVFDGGVVRSTHVEFALNRIKVVDSGSTQGAHATHVAGTMAAKGVNPKALGMAPALQVESYDWEDDLGQLDALPGDVSVSNHSYGPVAGWSWDDAYGWIWWGDTTVSPDEDSKFGKYTLDHHVLDDVLWRHPKLLTVVAAGNERNDGPVTQPVAHYEYGVDPSTGSLGWFVSYEVRPLESADHGGLDTIAGLGLSKNSLCVGAINDLFQDGAPLPGATLETTYFSSWGPADDGRIKPDVVANGDTLLSPTLAPFGASSVDAAYQEMSGTSMASPTTAGVAAVLAEFFNVKKGALPTSSELKALLIHTATDAGPVGPDPMYGWGSINAFRAGEVIAGVNGATVLSDQVTASESKTFNFVASSGPVRVTIVWLDPPALPNTSGVDDATPALRNDLDLTVTSPSGSVCRPFRLVPTGGSWVATADDQPNRVDNVEVVETATVSGAWTVRVTAAHLAQGPNQAFALVVTGLKKAG